MMGLSLRLQRRKQSDSRGFGDFVSAPVPLRVHVCAYVSLWASPCVYVCACVPVCDEISLYNHDETQGPGQSDHLIENTLPVQRTHSLGSGFFFSGRSKQGDMPAFFLLSHPTSFSQSTLRTSQSRSTAVRHHQRERARDGRWRGTRMRGQARRGCARASAWACPAGRPSHHSSDAPLNRWRHHTGCSGY